MKDRRLIGRAMLLGASLLTGPANACRLDVLSGDSLTVAHPGSISVAMAVYDAVEDGTLEMLPLEESERLVRLHKVRVLATRHVSSLWNVEKTASSPLLYVLLTQSGAWMRMGGGGIGPAYHSDPPPAGAAVVLVPDLAYEQLLRGYVLSEDLERRGLLRIWSDDTGLAREAWLRSLDPLGTTALSSH